MLIINTSLHLHGHISGVYAIEVCLSILKEMVLLVNMPCSHANAVLGISY